ncbi:MAG: SpoIID/LytB domain-containing protein [Chlamydiales bacterium]
MKTSLFAAALLCSAISPMYADEYTTYERIAEPMAPRNIQILLEKDADGVLLEVKGPYYIFNQYDGTRVASGLLGKRFMIHELENGLKWGEEFPGIHQIYIKPRSSETSIFINGIQYAGSIAIYGVAGRIHVVNDIDIESYVKAKLTSQFLSPLEPEVMSALAILARTDAYYQAMRAHPSSFWHVSAGEVGYQGSALVVASSLVDRAVESTRHLILLHSEEGKDLPFPTTWTENSGGKTAPYSRIFRKETFAPEKGVEAPHAALARQKSKWSYQIGKKTLAHLLNVSQISSIEPFMDKESSKVYGVRIKDGSASVDIDFLTLQSRIGAAHLQSSDFTVALKEDAVRFDGFGKGHGVGLCLYSANVLALNGENAVKILSKFFPETYLYNLNAVPK